MLVRCRLLLVLVGLLAALVPAAPAAASKHKARPKALKLLPGRQPVNASRSGNISRKAALSAFAGSIAPLPGVRPQPPGRAVTSGSGPIRWALRYRKAMTKAQRRAFDRAIRPTRKRARAASGAPPYDTKQRFDGMVAKARAGLEAHLGPLKRTPEVIIEQQLFVDKDNPLGSDKYYADTTPDDHFKGCDIRVFPPTWSAPDAEAFSTIAHEVAHCFEIQIEGKKYLKAGSWLDEGGAQWAGIAVSEELGMPPVGLPDRTYWSWYLKKPSVSLFERTYDGFGFFAQLKRSGQDPWALLPKMWKLLGGEKAYELIDESALDTWASGFARQPDWGADWDMVGPGITHDKADTTDIGAVGIGGEARLQVDGHASGLASSNVTAPVLEIATKGAHGRIRGPGGEAILMGNGAYCAAEAGCAPCPNGTTLPRITAGNVVIALSSGRPASAVELTGRDVDDYCKKPEQGPGQLGGPAGSVQPAPGGGSVQCLWLNIAGGLSVTYPTKEDPEQSLFYYGYTGPGAYDLENGSGTAAGTGFGAGAGQGWVADTGTLSVAQVDAATIQVALSGTGFGTGGTKVGLGANVTCTDPLGG